MDTHMRLLRTMAAHAIPIVPRALIQKISRRYIAGETLEDAITCTHALNAQGFCVTLDVLGETVSTSAQAASVADQYLDALDAIRSHELDANVSIKPSALGMLLDTGECEHLVEQIAEAAASRENAICIDMEDVSCTQKEIDLFASVKSRHDNVGLALQAYLRRTYQDLEVLARERSTLRICKGIYVEERSHLVDGAWSDRTSINTHFLNHVACCFDAGSYVGIATHDAQLIDQIVELIGRKDVHPAKFEFQMLLGVCESLRDKLLGMGFRVRIYVPYGKDWYGYSTRRMKENPSIAGHVMKAMIGM
jgi:proline dehydrogenase